MQEFKKHNNKMVTCSSCYFNYLFQAYHNALVVYFNEKRQKEKLYRKHMTYTKQQ